MNGISIECISNESLKRELTVGKKYEILVSSNLETFDALKDGTVILTDYGQPMIFTNVQLSQYFKLNGNKEDLKSLT